MPDHYGRRYSPHGGATIKKAVPIADQSTREPPPIKIRKAGILYHMPEKVKSMLIKIEDGKMKVQSDYNKKFVAKAHELQGKWEPPYWVFPEENEELVREALFMIYGEDGRTHETVIIDIDLDRYEYENVLKVGQIVIARREYRDSAVITDKRAVVIKGGFCSSGGSRNNPRVTHKDGTVIRVKDIPAEIFEEIKDSEGVTKVDMDAEENRAEKKAALIRERETLLKRLSEIDSQLEAYM